MNAPFDVLRDFLEEEGLVYEQLEGELVYRVAWPSKFPSLTWTCYAQVDADWGQFVFYVLIPVRIAEDLRGVVAEYITRVNYGLRVGKLEMDFEDGELRYNSTLNFKGERLTGQWIRNAVFPAIRTVERYSPGFAGIIRGGKTAAQALTEIEGKQNADQNG